MTDRKRLYCLVLIMTGVAVIVGGIAILGLYQAAITNTKKRLRETAQSQARLIEAMARFDREFARDYPEGPEKATLNKLLDAHENFAGIGDTGEFTLGRLEGETIVFLLGHKHADPGQPEPISWSSHLAEPMRRALNGESDTIEGLDYRGKTVLAAHEPIAELDLGIVAKIDLAEVRRPFVISALLAAFPAIVVVLGGTWLFLRVSTPLLQSIQERDARLLAILDSVAESIITIDEHVNRATESMFGCPAAELIGTNINRLIPPPNSGDQKHYLELYFETDKDDIIGSSRQTEAVQHNGATFPIDISVSEVQLGNRRLFTGIIRDITDRLRAEEKVHQSQRLVAIGQMVTGLAHESRNAIQRAQACLEMLTLDLGDQPEMLDLTSRTQDALEDLQRLYEEVRGYATPIQLEIAPTTVADVVSRTWADLQSASNVRGFELIHESEGSDTALHADRYRVAQIVRNVFENAFQACGESGSIRVTYEKSTIGDSPAIALHIRDDGPGIAKEQAAQIFEPFFTTKSKGTGLGMAIAKRIVDSHGGAIAVANAGQAGAEFVVTLPKDPE